MATSPERPCVFVGSSSEGLAFARAVLACLEQDHDIEASLWKGLVPLSTTVFDALPKAADTFDFAVIVFTPDDLVESRATTAFGPRDNVIFELGLFMGKLGPSRTFILKPHDSALKMPSDLSGVITATYQWPRKHGGHLEAVGAACDEIRRQIQRLSAGNQDTGQSAVSDEQRISMSVERFWQPYISNNLRANKRTLLLYTEPLFWRDGRIFLRSLDINDETYGMSLTPAMLKKSGDAASETLAETVDKLSLTAVHQFVSAGEALSIAKLTRLFTRLGIDVEFDVEHLKRSIMGRDLVIIGNQRTHWAVRKCQERNSETDIKITDRNILVNTKFESEMASYADERPGKPTRKVYALVTRCASADPAHTTTMIAANNGRAFQAVTQYITDGVELSSLFQKIQARGFDELPRTFQLCFSAHIDEDDALSQRNATLITTRPWGPI